MLIDHIGIAVSDYEKSKAFYSKALAPLGIVQVGEDQGWSGFGKDGQGAFWFGEDDIVQPPMHIAFCAENRAQVDQFYAAAIAAGATDNGQPGIRTQYHANYYGAFVIDLNGHNLEAVCHHSDGA